jgi:hypothetical protein
MEHPKPERRGRAPNPSRQLFGDLVRFAIRGRVRETRAVDTMWHSSANLGWARWAGEDGRLIYCGVRRKHSWITGEMGISQQPLVLDQLTLVPSLTPVPAEECRIQLGMLLHGTDKWWSFGGTEKGLVERLDWIALQMNLRMYSFLASTPPPRARATNDEDSSAA